MKRILLITLLSLLPFTAQAEVKFRHLESTPDGWRLLYYAKNEPIVVFVPRCSETRVMDCAWNKTTAKNLGKELASPKEKK